MAWRVLAFAFTLALSERANRPAAVEVRDPARLNASAAFAFSDSPPLRQPFHSQIEARGTQERRRTDPSISR